MSAQAKPHVAGMEGSERRLRRAMGEAACGQFWTGEVEVKAGRAVPMQMQEAKRTRPEQLAEGEEEMPLRIELGGIPMEMQPCEADVDSAARITEADTERSAATARGKWISNALVDDPVADSAWESLQMAMGTDSVDAEKLRIAQGIGPPFEVWPPHWPIWSLGNVHTASVSAVPRHLEERGGKDDCMAQLEALHLLADGVGMSVHVQPSPGSLPPVPQGARIARPPAGWSTT
eukprot:gnl/TRDRNA2_/TRDRNA2_175303_c0_seq1.p2 gnl/TRDRNA2_/TRDRNA2_175303_c0~~gnl/TRDRNA2_/TRDRNA2_175303_c0_seq1.p2  ORF type:complete len:233 (+),score=36.60 gnl/TRDRNA2_/TRDRNA2_175303_c0_seq1:2-700(+)